MFFYGKKSRDRLATCHPILQEIAEHALGISPYDITIIHGLRGEAVQNALYDSHASTKQWPNSRHNATQDPEVADHFSMSDALDFAPVVNGKIPWDDTHIFAAVAGVLMSSARSLGYELRWGGDWDGDGETTDQKLMDWGHVEINW